MGLLSNLLRFRHDSGAQEGPLVVRLAQPQDVEPALRLILTPPGATVDPAVLTEFAKLAGERGLGLDALHVAQRNGRVVSALLPVISPGRTALLLCPHEGGPKPAAAGAITALAHAASAFCATRGVHLVQALVEPGDSLLQQALAPAGLQRMAELFYLHVAAPQNPTLPDLPHGISLVAYSPQLHDWFGRTVLATYQQSLDCPALNGRRAVEDILAGHKASGEFDPSTWFLLREGDAALGVLLLSVSLRNDAMELVYLGLAAGARGRKLGELLMRVALATTSARKLPRLCLAVDSQNTPALKLYYRHGMQRVGSKLALLRDLRTDPVVP